MFSRTSGIFLVLYLLMVLAGIQFLLLGDASLIADVSTKIGTAVWGSFYLVGGIISTVATILRPAMLGRISSLWFFEVAGASLIITANLIYTYAMYVVGSSTGRPGLFAIATITLGLAVSMVARCVEVLGLIRYLKQYPIVMTDDEEGN